MTIRTHHRRPTATNLSAILARASFAALLWLVAGGAHAASIYRCTGAHGETTFRDTPCASQARQTKLDVAGQPLLDADAPPPTLPAHATQRTAARVRNQHAAIATHRSKTRSATSWECRAADGEVFYRHTRCPGSVAGDGTVRSGYAEKVSSQRTRGRHNAWSKISVHGKPIARAEACRRILSPSAAGRDGHQRDDRVSTYDHLMGRDPCSDM